MQKLPPGDYAKLAITTATIIKAADGDAQVYLQLASQVSYLGSVLAAVKTANALEMFAGATFHPYEANPDDEYGSLLSEMRAVVAKFSSRLLVVSAESGAPSVRGGYGALGSLPWNETSQAKWNLRRMLGDISHGQPWMSLFSIADMCYIKDGKMDVNHKGLLLVNCSLPQQPVIRPKQAYYGIQFLTTLFDASVKLLSYRYERTNATDGTTYGLSVAEFVASGARNGRILAAWTNGATHPGIPSGRLTMAEGPTFRTAALLPNGTAALSDLLLVDVRLGDVYAPDSSVSTLPGSIPLYDSPVILAERPALPPFAPQIPA